MENNKWYQGVKFSFEQNKILTEMVSAAFFLGATITGLIMLLIHITIC